MQANRAVAWGGATAGLLLSLLLVPAAVSARMIERVAAVVNEDIILLSELNERLRPLLPQLQQIQDQTSRQQKLEELKRTLLQMMIDEELIRQEAVKLKLTVTDKDLELAISDVMRKNNLTREGLEAALKQEGKTLDAYKDTILRPQLLRLRVLNVQVRSRIMVGDEEVKVYYQKNLRALGVGSKVHARHIFVKLPQDATPKQIEERRRYAQSLLARIKKGEDFGALAKEYSQDSNTREEGGDLGWFERGNLPSAIEEEVFTLKKGEVRGPLMAEQGFHLIQLLDRKESEARSFDEVKDELREQLYVQKMEKATQAWLGEVRKKSHVDIKL